MTHARRASACRLALVLGWSAMLAAGCTRIETIPLVATSITSGSGDRQTGVSGEALPLPVQVEVLDQLGNPIAGARVTWFVTLGNGNTAQPFSTTDAHGVAGVNWILGNTNGRNGMQGQIVDGSTATFTATGVSGPLDSLLKISSDSQTVNAGTASTPLQVAGLDQHGNVVTGAVITWSTTNGSLSATSTTTDGGGVVQVQVTPSVAGTLTVTASATGAAPVHYTLIAR